MAEQTAKTFYQYEYFLVKAFIKMVEGAFS